MGDLTSLVKSFCVLPLMQKGFLKGPGNNLSHSDQSYNRTTPDPISLITEISLERPGPRKNRQPELSSKAWQAEAGGQ